jgi:hypothetical protein
MWCFVYQQRRNGYSYKKNGDAIGERLAITAWDVLQIRYWYIECQTF